MTDFVVEWTEKDRKLKRNKTNCGYVYKQVVETGCRSCSRGTFVPKEGSKERKDGIKIVYCVTDLV